MGGQRGCVCEDRGGVYVRYGRTEGCVCEGVMEGGMERDKVCEHGPSQYVLDPQLCLLTV